MGDLWSESEQRGEQIKAALPSVKGRLTAGAPLMRLSWFRTGGPADLLFEPDGEEALIHFLRVLPVDVPVTVLGVGSNVLVRDGGLRGVVIRLGRSFGKIYARGTMMTVGAAAMDAHVAKEAQKAAITGMEFLIGVPGTIGGAVFMNAGAYGAEIRDVLTHIRAVDRQGRLHEIDPADYSFTYRKSGLPKDWIILSATLEGEIGDADMIAAQMKEIMTTRSESQPIGTRTGGSTFKNPDPELSDGRSAWQLIDAAGCRGLRIGDAQISEKHCNFLINHGTATAADIEKVGEEARQRVHAETGVLLEWEVKIIGEEAPENGL